MLLQPVLCRPCYQRGFLGSQHRWNERASERRSRCCVCVCMCVLLSLPKVGNVSWCIHRRTGFLSLVCLCFVGMCRRCLCLPAFWAVRLRIHLAIFCGCIEPSFQSRDWSNTVELVVVNTCVSVLRKKYVYMQKALFGRDGHRPRPMVTACAFDVYVLIWSNAVLRWIHFTLFQSEHTSNVSANTFNCAHNRFGTNSFPWMGHTKDQAKFISHFQKRCTNLYMHTKTD